MKQSREEKAAEQRLKELREQWEEQKRKDKEFFLNLINPVLEIVECSYLVRPTTKKIWDENRGNHIYSYDLIGVPNTKVIVEVDQNYPGYEADPYWVTRITIRSNKNHQLTEELYLNCVSIDEIVKTIKLLTLKATMEDNLEGDPHYFEKFFGLEIE